MLLHLLHTNWPSDSANRALYHWWYCNNTSNLSQFNRFYSKFITQNANRLKIHLKHTCSSIGVNYQVSLILIQNWEIERKRFFEWSDSEFHWKNGLLSTSFFKYSLFIAIFGAVDVKAMCPFLRQLQLKKATIPNRIDTLLSAAISTSSKKKSIRSLYSSF